MNHRNWRPGLPCASPSLPRHSSRIGSAALLTSAFECALPYSKKLSAHSSCVNALAFSHNGRRLASAGDDMKVLVWNFRPESLERPDLDMRQHRANIFCLDFSCNDHFIYSGSVDQTVCKHDAGEGRLVSRFSEHTESIRGISSHPECNEIFLSASDDGMIHLFDARSGTRSVGSIRRQIEVSDVKYHPITGTLFLSTDEVGRVLLHDVRMAFDSSESGEGRLGAVMTYVTTPTRRPSTRFVHLNASSVVFDREGKRFVVTYMNNFPTLYEASDPYPLASFGGSLLPDGSHVPTGQRTYTNNCTTKHGSFGGPGLPADVYYTAGSDDFRAYVWKVPSVEELRTKRKVLQNTAWLECARGSSEYATEKAVGFTRGRNNDVYIPVDLNRPLFRLQGHNSIVNTSLIHPHLPHIVTSGVERQIVLHGPVGFSSLGSNVVSQRAKFVRTSEFVRPLPESGEESVRRYARAITSGHVIGGDEADVDIEEEKTIDFFDEAIRESLDVDLFDQARDLLSSDFDEEILGDRDEDSSDEDDADRDGESASEGMDIDGN